MRWIANLVFIALGVAAHAQSGWVQLYRDYVEYGYVVQVNSVTNPFEYAVTANVTGQWPICEKVYNTVVAPPGGWDDAPWTEPFAELIEYENYAYYAVYKKIPAHHQSVVNFFIHAGDGTESWSAPPESGGGIRQRVRIFSVVGMTVTFHELP